MQTIATRFLDRPISRVNFSSDTRRLLECSYSKMSCSSRMSAFKEILSFTCLLTWFIRNQDRLLPLGREGYAMLNFRQGHIASGSYLQMVQLLQQYVCAYGYRNTQDGWDGWDGYILFLGGWLCSSMDCLSAGFRVQSRLIKKLVTTSRLNSCDMVDVGS